MNPVGVIPIRSGSKKLPDKNMLFFNGKPLVCATIEAMLKSRVFKNSKDIYVSTDSVEYIYVIKNFYPEINYHLRSEKYATDASTTRDFLLNFLKKFKTNRDILLCQATSPLRQGDEIAEAYKLFMNRHKKVVSVNKSSVSGSLLSTMDENGFIADISGVDRGYRRQYAKKEYIPNGAIYITTRDWYQKEKSFFTADTLGYVMKSRNSIDIDSAQDFIYAKNLVSSKGHLGDYFQLVDACKLLFKKKKKLLISDGRIINLSQKFEEYFTVPIFQQISFFDIIKLFKTGIFNDCEALVLSVGSFDIQNNTLNSIMSCFKTLLEMIISRKIKLQVVLPLRSFYCFNVDKFRLEELSNEMRKVCEAKKIDVILFSVEPSNYLSVDVPDGFSVKLF